MNKPLYSIIIPCYNHENFITETIESIWKQNISNMEVIVIDDGSSDNSFKVLTQLKEKSPVFMQVFSQKNAGITKTLNRGLEIAQGKYISFCASDDQYFPNSIAPILEEIQKDDKLKIIYANAREFKEAELFEKMHNEYTISLLSLRACEIEKRLRSEVPRPLLVQCSIIEKEFINAVGNLDETLMLDDWPLNIEMFKYLCQHDLKHKFIDIDMVKYRFHDNNIHRNAYKMYLMIEELILRHAPKEIQKKFLAKEMYSVGQPILKGEHPYIGAKLLLKSQVLDFHFLKFLNVLRLSIKYVLRAIFTNKRH